jgi:hypothetical protein
MKEILRRQNLWPFLATFLSASLQDISSVYCQKDLVNKSEMIKNQLGNTRYIRWSQCLGRLVRYHHVTVTASPRELLLVRSLKSLVTTLLHILSLLHNKDFTLHITALKSEHLWDTVSIWQRPANTTCHVACYKDSTYRPSQEAPLPTNYVCHNWNEFSNHIC